MDYNLNLINSYNKVSDINKNLFLEKTNNKDDIEKDDSQSFASVLREKLNIVNEKQIESDILTQKMIAGDSDVSIHEVMLAGEEAKISLQLAMQVRNKLVEAYQEISRTQI